MRNLNQRELHGRNLRVDHATRDHGIDPKVRIRVQLVYGALLENSLGQ